MNKLSSKVIDIQLKPGWRVDDTKVLESRIRESLDEIMSYKDEFTTEQVQVKATGGFKATPMLLCAVALLLGIKRSYAVENGDRWAQLLLLTVIVQLRNED
jgi:hypothetical protein